MSCSNLACVPNVHGNLSKHDRRTLMSDIEPCPTCKNDVSKNATECPNCGENIKSKKHEIKQKQKVENFEKWWSDHPIIKKSVMASSIALCLVLLGWCAREQHIYEQAKERADLRDCDEAGKTAAGWSDTLYRACVERNEDKIQAAMRQNEIEKDPLYEEAKKKAELRNCNKEKPDAGESMYEIKMEQYKTCKEANKMRINAKYRQIKRDN